MPPLGRADAAYSAGLAGPIVEHTVARYEGDDADRLMDAVQEYVENCPSFTEERVDADDYRVVGLSFPALGDHTFAFRATGEFGVRPPNWSAWQFRWATSCPLSPTAA